MKTGRGQADKLSSDKRLRRMVTLSAVMHGVAITAVIIGATWSGSSRAVPVAYTVELVNPGALGTSLPGKRKPTPAPPAAVEEKPAVPPGPPAVEEKPAIPPPQPEVKVPEPEVKKPPPQPKEDPLAVKAKEQPKVEAPPPPKEVVKLPQKEKPLEKPPVKSQPEKAKIKEKKPEPKKAETKPPEKKTEQKKAETSPVQSQEERDKQIAAALEKIKTQSASPEERDKKILAAVERVRSQAQPEREESGFDGPGVGSGPPSIGIAPGESGGGLVRGLEFIRYTEEVKRRVKERWIVAQERPGLTATVRFGIRPDGKIFEVELMRPSGDGAFDQSVLRAVRAADPLPAPPQTYQQEFAVQKVEVTFGGEERAN